MPASAQAHRQTGSRGGTHGEIGIAKCLARNCCERDRLSCLVDDQVEACIGRNTAVVGSPNRDCVRTYGSSITQREYASRAIDAYPTRVGTGRLHYYRGHTAVVRGDGIGVDGERSIQRYGLIEVSQSRRVVGLNGDFQVIGTVELPSLACRVKLAVADASQLATMSAVILPPVLTMLEIVTPLRGFAEVTVTVTLPLPPSSVTEAICELVTGEPCCRDNPAAAAIVGAGLHAPRRIETVFELMLGSSKILLAIVVEISDRY